MFPIKFMELMLLISLFFNRKKNDPERLSFIEYTKSLMYLILQKNPVHFLSSGEVGENGKKCVKKILKLKKAVIILCR